jgi:hypothetical protein
MPLTESRRMGKGQQAVPIFSDVGKGLPTSDFFPSHSVGYGARLAMRPNPVSRWRT